MASPLILKRTKLSRPSGEWQDEYCDVLADGKVVERIYERGGVGTPPDMIVPAVPQVDEWARADSSRFRAGAAGADTR